MTRLYYCVDSKPRPLPDPIRRVARSVFTLDGKKRTLEFTCLRDVEWLERAVASCTVGAKRLLGLLRSHGRVTIWEGE